MSVLRHNSVALLSLSRPSLLVFIVTNEWWLFFRGIVKKSSPLWTCREAEDMASVSVLLWTSVQTQKILKFLTQKKWCTPMKHGPVIIENADGFRQKQNSIYDACRCQIGFSGVCCQLQSVARPQECHRYFSSPPVSHTVALSQRRTGQLELLSNPIARKYSTPRQSRFSVLCLILMSALE